MSTETGPDLSSAVRAVTALMDDTVRVSTVTDPDAWELNPATLRLEPPSGTVIYEGRCKTRPLGNAAQGVTDEGGQFLGLDGYRLDIPIDSPVLPEGATAVLTSSRRMTNAVGSVFSVKRLTVKTLAVQDSYAAERRTTISGGGPLAVPGPATGGGGTVTEDPADPGTFIGTLSEDPGDPGTFQ